MSRKKVLYVITKSNFGGAQRYVFDLASEIPNSAYESVVALGGQGVLKEKLDEAVIRTITIDKLGRDINIFKEFSVFFTLIKLFKKEKPDIVHLNSSKIGGLGSLAGRVAGVPNIIFTGHGWAFNEDRNPLSKIVIFILHVLTIMFSDRTIAVSEKTKRQIVHRMPFLAKKMPVIYNGMSKVNFVPKDDARNHLYSILDDKRLDKNVLWVGTIGELHHIKGHACLIEAFSGLKESEKAFNIKLLIIGEGEERKKLEKLITERRLNKEVFLIGRVEDARRFLRSLDVFVFPSLSEAMPYALIEAGFAGLPVIASEVGGIPEIIEDKDTGILIHPKDTYELRDRLLDLIENKEKRESLGQKLQQNVVEKFSKSKMVSDTIRVYEREL